MISRGILYSKSDMAAPCAVMIFLSYFTLAGTDFTLTPFASLSVRVTAKVLISISRNWMLKAKKLLRFLLQMMLLLFPLQRLSAITEHWLHLFLMRLMKTESRLLR